MISKGRRTGGTLIESLITMALLSVILLVIAITVRRYSQVIQYADKKAQTFIVTAALVDAAREASQAVSLVQPALGSVATTPAFRFRRLTPSSAAAIPETAPPFVPGAVWNIHAASEVMTVRYHLVGADFVRTVNFPSGPPASRVLATSLTAFRANYLVDGGIELQADVQEKAIVRTLKAKTFLWRVMP